MLRGSAVRRLGIRRTSVQLLGSSRHFSGTTPKGDHDAQQLRQREVIERLLVMRSLKSNASYESLPLLFEAPDLLQNPRLSPLVTPIDQRLLAPFYNDIDSNNERLKFFSTGDKDDVRRSHYVRSFMPHCRPGASATSRLLYVKNPETHRGGHLSHDHHHDHHNHTPLPLPWQALAQFLCDTFASIGLNEFRDFYTHVLPAGAGRHLPHKDKLQAGTWKVDVRFSPRPTELLILDDVDGRWYALRFPAGGSGFVIDSALFARFHAVRAGPAIQQSVLAVFNKQGSTRELMCDAWARQTAGVAALATDYHRGAFKAFALPWCDSRHPPLTEKARVALQSATHFRNCLEMLRTAVRSIEPNESRQDLRRAHPSVIERALVTLPSHASHDVRKAYHCYKLMRLARYRSQPLTSTLKRARIEGGKKNQTVIDDRYISVHGSAHVDGEQFQFREYDGTDATRIRFSWRGGGSDRYGVTVSTDSGNDNARNLALLARKLGLDKSLTPLRTVFVHLDVIDGDTITGTTAALMRDLGLTLSVVPSETDHASKRLRERNRQRKSNGVRAQGFPKRPVSSWNYFLQDFTKTKLKVAFDQLAPFERKVYEDKAELDRSRYQTQLSEWHSLPQGSSKRPSLPLSRWHYFVQDHMKQVPGKGKERLRALAKVLRSLSADQKKVYDDKADTDQLRYQTQLSEWRSTHPELRQRPLSSWQVFLQGNVKGSGSIADKIRAAKSVFDQLESNEKQVYQDKADQSKKLFQLQQSNPDLMSPPKLSATAWAYFVQDRRNELAKEAFNQLSSTEKQLYETRADADKHRYQTELSEWRSTSPALNAFEVFCTETSPALLQQHPGNYDDRQGQIRLKRDLRAEWQRLGKDDWLEYDRKARAAYQASMQAGI